jgi:3-oxoacyl-[acyl-carrier-protein] synthase II
MMAAASEAVKDAKCVGALDPDRMVRPRQGFVVSSICGEIDALWADFHKPQDKAVLLKAWTSIAGSAIADAFDLRGPGYNLQTACSGGLNGVGEAMWRIKSGEVDGMLVVAGDIVNPVSVRSMKKVVSTTARPFDVNRNGFVFGEGAGALWLEGADVAESRGAAIYAEVCGYACNSEAKESSPDSYGTLIEEGMKRASKGPVDLVYAHANGTKNDAVEARTLERMFKSVAVTSVKGQVGQAQGAIGAFSVAFACATLSQGIIPAIANLNEPLEADLDFVRKLRRQDVQSVLINSFGLGGANATIVLKRSS